jgi:hypothetical protein
MSDRTVTTLNALLGSELLAVACYNRVLRHIPKTAPGRSEIEECLGSHHGRAARLAMEVSSRGGEPLARIGLWGCILAWAASMLASAGLTLATRLLRNIESRGIRKYDESWDAIDVSARNLLTTCLFPQQVLSHQGIALLNDSVGSLGSTQTS